MNNSSTFIILHITESSSWQHAQMIGFYQTPSLANKGFIHCSEPHQVVAVANYLYKGQDNLVVLCVDPKRLASELRYEALATEEPYPHVYGVINLEAVIKVVDFKPDAKGVFTLPSIS